MKMTRRIFSLVLAMMMLVGTMFAIPVAAHDHEHLETELCGLFVMRDGVLVPLAELVESCGCSNPVIEDYSLEPPPLIVELIISCHSFRFAQTVDGVMMI